MIPEIKRLQPDGMGWFLGDFMVGWWKKATRDEAIEKAMRTLRRFHRLGASRIKFFAWLHDGHWMNKYVAHITPWIRSQQEGRPFNLAKQNAKWFNGYRKWLELLRDTGNKPLCVAFMARYCWRPFSHNVNGVRYFYDVKAQKYQVAFINRLISIEREVFGPNHKIHFCMLNEPGHYGNHKKLHEVADWHRDIYRSSLLRPEAALKRMYFDSSMCEGAHAHFVERHRCPKCTPNEIYGDGHFGGYFTSKRIVQIINHGYSIPENVGDDFDHWAGSAWRPPSMLWVGGDGGAGKFTHLARGFKLNRPSGAVAWAQGNATQTRIMHEKVWGKAKARGKNAGSQLTFFETLKGWPWQEDFTRKNIKWARVIAVIRAHRNVYGA